MVEKISILDGKYTFILTQGDYQVHCLLYGEPWWIFERGSRAVAALVRECLDLKGEDSG